MRPRFSLRWILIFVAVVAIACQMVRPTIVAKQYVASLSRGGPAALVDVGSGKLVQQLQEYDRECAFSTIQMEVLLQQATWGDLLNVRRRVTLNFWLPTKLSRERIKHFMHSGRRPEPWQITDDPNDDFAFLTMEMIVLSSGPTWDEGR